MARVLFIVPMDAERRATVARKAAAAFEPVILEDLPPEKRDEAWATADVVVSMGFPREFPPDFRDKALAGTAALVLGFGGIGSEIARLCKAFDMHVVGVARSRPSSGIADDVGTMKDLPRYLPQADAVFLALPLTRATLGLVDRGFL